MGAWIETAETLESETEQTVAPLVGAWIETSSTKKLMKLILVAPLVGAWIETAITPSLFVCSPVAPLVGAWIETAMSTEMMEIVSSHPSWVRGLKHVGNTLFNIHQSRTPRGCVD